MYKLDLPVDYKEAAAIERRRNQEEQRKSRIFNAKTRIIGLDLQAVEQQVNDRKQMEDLEKKRDQAFANDAIRTDKIAQLLENRQEHDIRELSKALNEFRFLHQQPEARREFDLYDPEGLRKDKPARVSDDDPRCGISSLQKFDGEDLNNKARTKFQQEQLREWSEAQAREKNQCKQNQDTADRLYDLKMKELDQRAMELQDAEEACRRAINMATSDYNRALANELASKKALQEQQDLDDKLTELANHVYGDILTENPAVAQSAFGAHRVITDRWKGMSPEQIADIRRMQEIQRKENQRKQDEEKRRDAEYERQSNAHARAGLLMERQQERTRRELQKQFVEENKRLNAEQKSHKEFLDNEDRETSAKRDLSKQQELDDNMTELANHVYGDILTENPSVAQSAFGAHRVITDRWKGMSPEQLADIRRTQDLQRKENQRLKDEERRRQAEWERQTNAHARAGMLLEREKERREKAIREQLANENKGLGNEQLSHKEFLDQEVYTNRPTGAYFMQFNQSTR